MCHQGKAFPRREGQTKCMEGRKWTDHCNTNLFYFPFRGLPSGMVQRRGTLHIVCGPLLAVVCHLLIHAAVFIAFKVKQSSIFSHSLLLFQRMLVHENMKCSVCSSMLRQAEAKAKTTGYQSAADHYIKMLGSLSKSYSPCLKL